MISRMGAWGMTEATAKLIDLGQQIAGLDVLSFGECDFVELTIHPDLYHNGVEGLDGP